jgi:HEPN domain-containing protein/predicted nucleotidyltransferase
MKVFLDPISNEKNRRYKVWLDQSEYDLKAARDSFNSGNYEWACYQSIQSVEKILKSVIVHSGFRPPKTHKLSVLIAMSNRANDLFKDVKFSFRKIEGYTFISRYPFVFPGQDQTPHDSIKKQDAETCIKIATDIQNKIESFLKNNKPSSERELNMSDYYFSNQEVDKRISEVKDKLFSSEKLKLKKIILFGSFAREKERPRSTTMDLLVVAETVLNFIERIQHVRTITKGAEPIIEPIVYTPSEFTMMLEDEGEGFLESAIQEGKVLYDFKE